MQVLRNECLYLHICMNAFVTDLFLPYLNTSNLICYRAVPAAACSGLRPGNLCKLMSLKTSSRLEALISSGTGYNSYSWTCSGQWVDFDCDYLFTRHCGKRSLLSGSISLLEAIWCSLDMVPIPSVA